MNIKIFCRCSFFLPGRAAVNKIGVFYISRTHNNCVSRRHSTSSGSGWNKWPVEVEVSCEYTE